MSATSTTRPTTGARPAAVVELRRYVLHPGRRDSLVDLFERELIEPQEEAGMEVIGQFVDLDDPDRFVWLRGFPDLRARRDALAAFYDGPVWAAHRAAANATMVNSDDVLLLRPARPGAGFDPGGERPAPGARPGPRGAVAATVVNLDGPGAEDDAVAVFDSALVPVVAHEGGEVLGSYVTETARNDFPRLPVREGEHVLAWFAGFRDVSALDAAAEPLATAIAATLGRLPSVGRIERRRLLPTARSLLAGRTR